MPWKPRSTRRERACCGYVGWKTWSPDNKHDAMASPCSRTALNSSRMVLLSGLWRNLLQNIRGELVRWAQYTYSFTEVWIKANVESLRSSMSGAHMSNK